MAMTAAPQQQQQPQPVDTMQHSGQYGGGQLFSLPGITTWSEQYENNDGVTATLAAAAQTTQMFGANFKQTDIVYSWVMGVNIALGGNPAATVTPYFPYNFLGQTQLNIQNQFNTVNVESGIDMGIFQAIRPSKNASYMNWVDTGPVAPDAYSNTTPTAVTSAAYTGTSTSMTFWLDLMPCVQFDLYYDLAEDGRLYENNAGGIRAIVTPQMMAGTNRVVQPAINWNAVLSATNGAGSPYSAWTPQTVTTTLNFRRNITYQPTSDAAAPLLFNWQYTRDTRRFSLAGQSVVDIPLPLVGQILMFYIRMWDGTNNAPIAVTTVTKANVLIGSGLFRFQDTYIDTIRRLYRQHGIFLPAGCLAWDMAYTDEGRLTNRAAINTYTTSGPTLHLEFTGAQTAGSYLVMGVESLRYVTLQ
jgi:hypothetical protein